MSRNGTAESLGVGLHAQVTPTGYRQPCDGKEGIPEAKIEGEDFMGDTHTTPAAEDFCLARLAIHGPATANDIGTAAKERGRTNAIRPHTWANGPLRALLEAGRVIVIGRTPKGRIFALPGTPLLDPQPEQPRADKQTHEVEQIAYRASSRLARAEVSLPAVPGIELGASRDETAPTRSPVASRPRKPIAPVFIAALREMHAEYTQEIAE